MPGTVDAAFVGVPAPELEGRLGSEEDRDAVTDDVPCVCPTGAVVEGLDGFATLVSGAFESLDVVYNECRLAWTGSRVSYETDLRRWGA